MAKRRRNKVVLWEWSRSGKGKGLKPGFALIATGLGFLYFGWLYSATGIFTGRRGRVAIVASEEPERFSYAVGMVVALGVASLAAGALMMRRK